MSLMSLPAAQVQPCAHCQSSVSQPGARFCCPGCETVYGIITERGWHNYYRLRESSRQDPLPVSSDKPSFAFLNTEAYRSQWASSADGCFTADWYLTGVHCTACIWLIEKASAGHEGINDAELQFATGRLRLTFRENVNLEVLASTLADLGYIAGIHPQAQSRETGDPRLLRIGLAGALAGNIMMMSLPFYLGLTDGQYAVIFAWLSFALSIPLLLYGAKPFFTKAMSGIRAGVIHLDLPICLGLAGAFIWSTFNLSHAHYHSIYFDTMGMLVFFLLVGRFVQERAVEKAIEATQKLLAQMPQMTETWRNESWQWLPSQELQPGDTMRFRCGDIIPVDGALQTEGGIFNLHVVSGETKPVKQGSGDQILAGSVNMGGMIEIKALSKYRDSRFAKLEETARNLKQKRPQKEKSRLGGSFLAFVSLCAVGGFLGWLPSDMEKAFSVALTILIVACPCALALAAPTARAMALHHAAKLGVWIKSLHALEAMTDIGHIVFDKTGILTQGKPTIAASTYFTSRKTWLESAILALENTTHHPVAEAFKTHFNKHLPLEVEPNLEIIPGVGLSGTVDRHEIVISSPSGLDRWEIAAETQQQLAQAIAQMPTGSSLVCVCVDGKAGALFALKDEPAPGTSHMLDQLKQRNMHLEIWSGDAAKAVAETANLLGIAQYRGNMLPEDKLGSMKAKQGQVMMAGDGLNDMGALAAADVAVTHSGATHAALRFADIVFQGRDISPLARVLDLALVSKRATQACIALSLLYNICTIAFALMGTIGPLAAAILMPISSASVIGLSAAIFRRRSRVWASY